LIKKKEEKPVSFFSERLTFVNTENSLNCEKLVENLSLFMNIDLLRDYCLKKDYVTEDFPFDETTLVFRVGGKIFALTDLTRVPLWVNLKCNPEYAIDLREKYDFIIPGWHMNKKHWNTVILNDTTPDSIVFELVDLSYRLVLESLSRIEKVKGGILL
jgi:predicted DNA-binding protein (MmcQ/YjbR family)